MKEAVKVLQTTQMLIEFGLLCMMISSRLNRNGNIMCQK